ncbi:Putative membrane ycf1 [Gossypium arboreum]|uniref:Putative membrane ycf1 n=1 Tax=Gossypium arboreum TaxID=29729 RepID=A0A0B0PJT3_GOSAR|nr:Putative membrane ycf1 [Gossypium arboreum]
MPQAFNRPLATSDTRPSGGASMMHGREGVKGRTDVRHVTLELKVVLGVPKWDEWRLRCKRVSSLVIHQSFITDVLCFLLYSASIFDRKSSSPIHPTATQGSAIQFSSDMSSLLGVTLSPLTESNSQRKLDRKLYPPSRNSYGTKPPIPQPSPIIDSCGSSSVQGNTFPYGHAEVKTSRKHSFSLPLKRNPKILRSPSLSSLFFAERLMPQAFNRPLATSDTRPSGGASMMHGREGVKGRTDVRHVTLELKVVLGVPKWDEWRLRDLGLYFWVGQNLGLTAAPLCSLLCNENEANTTKRPILPGLATSRPFYAHLLQVAPFQPIASSGV